jgi:Got1/Sft2-like family
LHQTILTLIAAIVQLLALLWYMISYFPMGTTGLRLASSFAGNRVAAWMND